MYRSLLYIEEGYGADEPQVPKHLPSLLSRSSLSPELNSALSPPQLPLEPAVSHWNFMTQRASINGDSEWKIHSLLSPILIFPILHLQRKKNDSYQTLMAEGWRHNPSPTIPLSHISLRLQRRHSGSLPGEKYVYWEEQGRVPGRLFQAAAGTDEGGWNASSYKP